MLRHPLDPVVTAAALAFGLVYIRPFEDGSRRIHRYLIHHVLAERGFNPSGECFRYPPGSWRTTRGASCRRSPKCPIELPINCSGFCIKMRTSL